MKLNHPRYMAEPKVLGILLLVIVAVLISQLLEESSSRIDLRHVAFESHPSFLLEDERAALVEYSFDQLTELETRLTERPLLLGNQVKLLTDGPATHEAMLQSIAGAQHHIHLEMFIYEDDSIAGKRFTEALIERRRAGVEVRVIIDAMGSGYFGSDLRDQMQAAGVETFMLHSLNPLHLLMPWKANQRHHRKSMIVDGVELFTGGVNVSDTYLDEPDSEAARRSPVSAGWRDNQLQINGSAVREFQRLFLDTWVNESGYQLPVSRLMYFPSLPAAGDAGVRMLDDIPETRLHRNYRSYLLMIENAQQRVWITNPYFLPPKSLLEALGAAAKRGVDVRLMFSEVNDSEIIRLAMQSLYTGLIKSGIKVYERQRTMVHAKTAIVDQQWSRVGSVNLDFRSLMFNAELDAVVIDEVINDQLHQLFLKDVEHAEEIQLEEWERRPVWLQAVQNLAGTFTYMY